MKALQKLSLTDYLKDATDIRLKLFIRSVNPEFIVTKAALRDIAVIIDDYKFDNSPSRLKLIEAYLSTATRKVPKSGKVSKLSLLTTSDPRTDELKRLSNECLILQRIPGGALPNPDIISKILTLKARMKELEEQLGMKSFDPTSGDTVDPAAIADYEKSLVVGILGPWEKTGTFAYEILHGHKPSFELKSPRGKNLEGLVGTDSEGRSGMEHVIGLLEKHSGIKARKFATRFFFGQGNGSAGVSGCKFVEIGSGLGWGNDTITDSDGKSVKLDEIYARPELGSIRGI